MIARQPPDRVAEVDVTPVERRHGKHVSRCRTSRQSAQKGGSAIRLQKGRRAPLFATGFVTILGGVLHCQLAVQQERKQEKPHGRYCARQVLLLSDRLYPRIAANIDWQLCSAEYREAPSAGEEYQHTWDVLYTNNEGIAAAYLVWNADTGQLLKASTGGPPIAFQSPKKFLRSEEAVVISVRRLTELGMMDADHRRWSLMEPPERIKRAWSVGFTAGNKKIRITIDAGSGALQMAHLW